MSLTRDREPVEVLRYWSGKREFVAARPTRYVIHKDGWLSWVHPSCHGNPPLRPRVTALSNWRKVKP